MDYIIIFKDKDTGKIKFERCKDSQKEYKILEKDERYIDCVTFDVFLQAAMPIIVKHKKHGTSICPDLSGLTTGNSAKMP